MRCSFIFENFEINHVDVCIRINLCVSEFWAVRDGSIILNACNVVVGRSNLSWCLPEKGALKINDYGSFVGKTGKGSIGVIVRDDEGRIIDGLCGSCCLSSGFMVEASALKMVVSLAERFVGSRIVVESDCSELVLAMKSRSASVVWGCSALLRDIIAALDSNDNFSISSIERNANLVTDWLAKCGAKEIYLLNWMVAPPSPLVILKKECGMLDDDVGIG